MLDTDNFTAKSHGIESVTKRFYLKAFKVCRTYTPFFLRWMAGGGFRGLPVDSHIISSTYKWIAHWSFVCSLPSPELLQLILFSCLICALSICVCIIFITPPPTIFLAVCLSSGSSAQLHIQVLVRLLPNDHPLTMLHDTIIPPHALAWYLSA